MPAPLTNARIALSKVLLATDFSEISEVAMPYALAIAREYCGSVLVGHVVAPEPHLSVPLEPLPPEVDPVWSSARSQMDRVLQSPAWRDIPHKGILRRGDLWPVIEEIIRGEQIDLLVTATHGRGGLRRLLMGSHAETMYRQASCPVLTVGPHVKPLAGAAWRPKRILFPTDGSDVSLHALPYALSFAEQNEATLTLLRLVPLLPFQYQQIESESSQKALRELVPADAAAWCNVEFAVDFDFPAEGILRAAEERSSELIVMGVRQSAMAATHMPWPIASEVVRLAACPVLTVRGQGRQEAGEK
jgi:nucleotide-binding universal stress UspA family protein